jgi:mannan polymerase II complex ANP1 subunit
METNEGVGCPVESLALIPTHGAGFHMKLQRLPSSRNSCIPKIEFYSRLSKPVMATPLNGTVVITGANGSLGSKIALRIARQYPFVHLLLTARDVWSETVAVISEDIRSLGPRSFEIAKLDLASFRSVRKFARNTVDRVRTGDIPSIQLLINCAAVASFKADASTEDGFDLVYQTNCLGPFLLTVSLLEAFRANDGDKGTRVINIGTSLMSLGKADYFDNHPSKEDDSPLGVQEGLARYGSSKLLLNAAMYALRRSLAMVRHLPSHHSQTADSFQTSKIDLAILTLDPGRMSNSSRLSTNAPVKLRITNSVLCGVRPFAQIFSKNIINDARRSADAIVKVAFEPLKHDRIGEEMYFVLDEACPVKYMVKITDDHEFMELFLRQTVLDVGLAEEEILSPV